MHLMKPILCVTLWCSVSYAQVAQVENPVTVYAQSATPVDGWVNYQLLGPSERWVKESGFPYSSRFIAFELHILPVDYELNPKRYAWSASMWTAGQPGLSLQLLLPTGVQQVPGQGALTQFYARQVTQRAFSSETQLGAWQPLGLGSLPGPGRRILLGQAINALAGIVSTALKQGLSFASAAQALGAYRRYNDVVSEFGAREFTTTDCPVPAPQGDIAALRYLFCLEVTPEAVAGDPVGVLVQIGKRNLLGQYSTQFHLLDFVLPLPAVGYGNLALAPNARVSASSVLANGALASHQLSLSLIHI